MSVEHYFSNIMNMAIFRSRRYPISEIITENPGSNPGHLVPQAKNCINVAQLPLAKRNFSSSDKNRHCGLKSTKVNTKRNGNVIMIIYQ